MARMNRNDQGEGHLYYVRLKTECGIFYKLGFTTLKSVQERLEYGGSSDVQYIDKILLFVKLHDAFEIEQKLHMYLSEKKAFGRYSAAKEFPLNKNGQTELYIEDVLQLDPDFTGQQSTDTVRKLKDKRLLIEGRSQGQAKLEDMFVNITVRILLVLLAPIFVAFIILISKLEGKNTKNELLICWDNVTGNKRKIAQDESELKSNLDSIMRRINYERNQQSGLDGSNLK